MRVFGWSVAIFMELVPPTWWSDLFPILGDTSDYQPCRMPRPKSEKLSYRSANTNIELPAAAATYCLPPAEYVIGPITIEPPSDIFHSADPVRASSAKK
jgi:hypothetical protein